MLTSPLLVLLPLLSGAMAAPASSCKSRGRPAENPGTTTELAVTATEVEIVTEATTTTLIGDNNAAPPPPSSSPPAPPPPPPPASSGGGGGGGGGSGNEQQDLFLSLHNDFRATYGAGALTWNQELANFAQGVADTCKMVHSGGPYGENLASGAGGGYSMTDGFNSWGNEASLYNWGAPGFQKATGHFTQVVWKGTTELGCAVANCPPGSLFDAKYGDGLHVVCEYQKAGNVVGNNGQYFRDNVGTLVG